MSVAAQSIFQTGRVVNDKWVILKLVGQGGMGEVYHAYQLNLKRDVAIKVISRKIIEEMGDGEDESSACLERFRREVEVMAQVQHPNVLKVFDFGSVLIDEDNADSSVEYIVMEFLPGPTLRTTMSEEGFYPEEDRTREWLTKCFLPVLDGVSALHALGIIHRDLKPENVMFDGASPKITDFGLARSSRLEPITKSVEIKGTPAYMSPEHFFDFRRTDERADVYSLGKMLYEAISGKINADQIPFKQVSLKQPDGLFFQDLDRIMRKATVEHKSERFQSTGELKAAIEELLLPKTPPRMPASFTPKRTQGVARTLVLTLAIAGLALFAARHYGVYHGAGTAPPAGLKSQTTTPKSVPNPVREAGPPSQEAGSPTTIGKDDAVLHLIPGGELPSGSAGTDANERPQVKSFYMDETLVTNYQFIDFLNESLSEISLQDNAVIVDGHPWIVLGEVVRGYEPVLFRNGRFLLNGAHHASCPVLRVTAYGASAYAHHYGKRLPSRDEWAYAALAGKSNESTPLHPAPAAQSSSHDGHGMNPDSAYPTPVLDSKPDPSGIRGLNGRIAEWTLATKDSKNPGYVVLGGSMNEADSKSPSNQGIKREPWEASEEISFRTVISSSSG